MSIFKGKSLKDKKSIAKFVKAMACELDCQKCQKTNEECIKGVRICLNILMKDWLKRSTKTRQKEVSSSTMVT